MRGRAALLFLCSCGLDESGVQTSANDASAPDVLLVDSPVEAAKEAGPPQPCSVDAGACVASLPSGWELVAFDPSNENACPSKFGNATVVSNVVPLTGACDCGCTVTTPPACNVGSLQRYISADTSCSQTGQLFTVNGGGCNVLTTTGGLSAYSKSSALAPSGGACTGDAIKSKGGVGLNKGAACTVPPACQEQFCGGDVPGGFESCIESPGAQACPAGWSTPVLAGDDFTFDCSTCTCDVNGPSTCTNATLTFFNDSNCTSSLVALGVDGQCAADPATGQTPQAWSYSATLNQACSATGAKTASNVQLSNERTICCK